MVFSIVVVVAVKELLSTVLPFSDAPDCSGTVVVGMVPLGVFLLPFVFDSFFFFLFDTGEALSPVVILSALVVVGGVWIAVVFAFFLGVLPIVVVVEAMTALVSMALDTLALVVVVFAFFLGVLSILVVVNAMTALVSSMALNTLLHERV